MSDTIMVDCIAGNIGAVKRSRFANNPAQAYVTGGGNIEWSDGQIMLFARHIRTAQSSVIGVDDVSDARELDVEQWAATPEDWPEFYDSRTDKARATCYCSLTTVPAVIEVCDVTGIPRPPRWRLAWWWKNTPGVPIPDDVDVPVPTVDQVAAELRALTGVVLPASSIWACQFANYLRWDLSIIYGTPDFARR